MKISLKNIIIGDIYMCSQLTENVDTNNEIVTTYNSKPCEENAILVKDKFDTYFRFEDFEDMGSLALSLYGAAFRFPSKPKAIKQKFVANTRPLFPDATDEKFSSKEIITIVNDYIHQCEV